MLGGCFSSSGPPHTPPGGARPLQYWELFSLLLLLNGRTMETNCNLQFLFVLDYSLRRVRQNVNSYFFYLIKNCMISRPKIGISASRNHLVDAEQLFSIPYNWRPIKQVSDMFNVECMG